MLRTIQPIAGLLVLALSVCSAAFATDPVVSSVTTNVRTTGGLMLVDVTFTFSEAENDACHIPLFGHGSTAGTYTVTLTVTSAAGTDSETKTNFILADAYTHIYVNAATGNNATGDGSLASSYKTITYAIARANVHAIRCATLVSLGGILNGLRGRSPQILPGFVNRTCLWYSDDWNHHR